jgi:hypothetical protein
LEALASRRLVTLVLTALIVAEAARQMFADEVVHRIQRVVSIVAEEPICAILREIRVVLAGGLERVDISRVVRIPEMGEGDPAVCARRSCAGPSRRQGEQSERDRQEGDDAG